LQHGTTVTITLPIGQEESHTAKEQFELIA